MIELQAGAIVIDGMDISAVPREEVRERLNTVPQASFFLSGTVRDNLDPLRLLDEDRIIAVLDKLNLRDWLDASGGLDENVTDDSLSHGQRQLLAFARGVLRPGQIVIMDEITSGQVLSSRLHP